MSNTRYCIVSVSWVFKPKVRTNSLQFSKLGRVSETANKNLNSLLSSITGFEIEVIKTGYAGEHVLSTPLAECLHYSTGYSIEHYAFIEIFEKFGGLAPSEHPQIMEKGWGRDIPDRNQKPLFSRRQRLGLSEGNARRVACGNSGKQDLPRRPKGEP
jgi:Mannosyl-3-phosphoglycerate synthase (osmo_MPGsynth)